MAENVLYYGDNLEILRRYIEDESVDLVYLDPPFKSKGRVGFSPPIPSLLSRNERRRTYVGLGGGQERSK